jgi:NhaA family Na+:H+ antiporter
MSARLTAKRPLSLMRNFLRTEAAGGIILMGAAAAALALANSPFAADYFATLHVYVGGLSLLHWINDGLMAIFFLVVGLEIKRELLDGQLATWERRLLPGAAAAAGMLLPAVIFAAINWDDPVHLSGWAIPAATDIAFALGVLALLGDRVPASLKVLLTAVAVLDDLGAVAIIAFFYTSDLAFGALALAIAGLAVLILLNRMKVAALWPYLLIGGAIWYFVLLSGVHATLAGVAVALTIPMRAAPGRPDDVESPLHRLEHRLQPWVAYLIVPIFGFANAGVSLAGLSPAMLLDSLPLGIAAGLFLGKQVGVFAAIWLCTRLRLADVPAGAGWGQVYGMSVLCGIGFTMSLFIGNIAFQEGSAATDAVKMGVLMGSIASAALGWLVMRNSSRESCGPARDTAQIASSR